MRRKRDGATGHCEPASPPSLETDTVFLKIQVSLLDETPEREFIQSFQPWFLIYKTTRMDGYLGQRIKDYQTTGRIPFFLQPCSSSQNENLLGKEERMKSTYSWQSNKIERLPLNQAIPFPPAILDCHSSWRFHWSAEIKSFWLHCSCMSRNLDQNSRTGNLYFLLFLRSRVSWWARSSHWGLQCSCSNHESTAEHWNSCKFTPSYSHGWCSRLRF